MVNEFGAQYWRYEFENNLPETMDDYERYYRLLPSIYIYAFSEEEAREKFKKYFEMEAGELLQREPW